MPITKRTTKKWTPPVQVSEVDGSKPLYHDFRKKMWEFIDRSKFEPRGSTYDGGKIPDGEAFLIPKLNLFFKDVWHCGSRAKARDMAQRIAGFNDVRYMELKERWVWVQWDHHMKDHVLEGQQIEDRSTYKGR